MNRCPACAAPTQPNETSCAACGLLFNSMPSGVPKLPPAPLSCPCCSAVQRPRALVCFMCGESLAIRELRAGEALDNGRFLVQAPLGQGGMGALYLASDQRAFGRRVVIKALGDEQTHEKASEQLRTEGWLLSQLRQPNMPHMLGYFEHGAQRFVAMEYIEGPNLHDQLSQYQQDGTVAQPGKPYSQHHVIEWGVAIARTLEYLHNQKPFPIIHQDIKPANLVLDGVTGMIKLIDFGNAALYQPGLGPREAFGTPGYAPREQYRGESEPRSDVYALAATLYHLASDDDPTIHPFRFPQLAQLGALGEMLAPALANEPAERPSAAVFRVQLETLQANHAIPQLHAPDGTTMEDESELVAWCEANWQAATAWLGSDLIAQVQRWRGSKRAVHLRTLVDTHPSPDAALDAWLAAIDPLGFGAAKPSLVASSRTFTVSRGGVTLTLANTGRRLVEAHVKGPQWLIVTNHAICLAPGQHAQVRLSRTATRAKRRAMLEVVSSDAALATCLVRPGA